MSKSHKKKEHSPDFPTAVWHGKDLFEGKPVDSLTVIFHTIGCHWSHSGGCSMCGYFNDSATVPPGDENLISQFDHVLKKIGNNTALIKIFTSGSFFDDREIAHSVRTGIFEKIGDIGTIKKIVAETRPEFVTEKKLNDSLEILDKYGIRLEIAVGLETSNDAIRKDCINKGFTFNDFIKASKTAKSLGVTTKAYLLLKPPFISEKAAIDDIIASITDAAPYATTISINLCNIQKGTLVEELSERKSYRPPWLWSAVYVLIKGKELFPEITLMSDPVAAGLNRGPHNCKKCDGDIAQILRDFSISQDTGVLSEVDCDCYPLWEKVIELEDNTFGSYLIK
ncbi:MAG: archaeosine biosynthesis radical SAM protein RaSEA [Methanosarcinales archaeon]|nr:archaeosine biosynthesis radical SAM protein RaSEA [Methanosarcinales archaeon]